MSTGERIAAEAVSWIGTPFRQGAGVKGRRGGVDCGQFLLRVFQAVALVPPGEPAPYVRNWFLYRDSDDHFGPWLRTHGQPLAADEPPLPGDVAGFRVGRATIGHVGIVEQWPAIVHAWPSAGVCRGAATTGELAGRLVGVWRYREAA